MSSSISELGQLQLHAIAIARLIMSWHGKRGALALAAVPPKSLPLSLELEAEML